MNERQITVKCMEATRLMMPRADITKHCDRFTRDIPDLSVSHLGGTCWVEMKYLRKNDRLVDIIEVGQLIKCHALATNTNGRCWIMVYAEHPTKCLTVWSPRALFASLYPKMAGPDEDGGNWKAVPCNASSIDAIIANPHDVLTTFGAIIVPGWPYDVLAKLVTAAAAKYHV